MEKLTIFRPEDHIDTYTHIDTHILTHTQNGPKKAKSARLYLFKYNFVSKHASLSLMVKVKVKYGRNPQ